MPTIAREIDALGGSSDEGESWNTGYSAAVFDAGIIAEHADALVEELLECIADALSGGVGLEQWTNEARTLVQRVSWRRSI